MTEKTEIPSESKPSLEERKLEAEIRLREEELALKRAELAAQIEKDKKTRWTPTDKTILVAVLGILGTGLGILLQGQANLNLEKKKVRG
jgi:hypothetical protein